MESINKSLGLYVAYLRALYFLHQQHHWTCSGPTFYALHKLFEEIYKSAADDVDEAAEKFIGLFGDDCLSYANQIEYLGQILGNLPAHKSSENDLVSKSLALEEKFLDYSNNFYNELKTNYFAELSMGMDDLLMEIASHREKACYHLRRTLKT